MTAQAFISYRRADTGPSTGRLYEALCLEFGSDHLFIDVDDIEMAQNFQEAIQEALDHTVVVIVVIGPQWLASDETSKSRLTDIDDPVRLEVETALRKNLPIFPVLMDGATMPAVKDLPDSLTRLALYNAASIRHDTWSRDIPPVIRALGRYLGETNNADRKWRIFPKNVSIRKIADPSATALAAGALTISIICALAYIQFVRNDATGNASDQRIATGETTRSLAGAGTGQSTEGSPSETSTQDVEQIEDYSPNQPGPDSPQGPAGTTKQPGQVPGGGSGTTEDKSTGGKDSNDKDSKDKDKDKPTKPTPPANRPSKPSAGAIKDCADGTGVKVFSFWDRAGGSNGDGVSGLNCTQLVLENKALTAPEYQNRSYYLSFERCYFEGASLRVSDGSTTYTVTSDAGQCRYPHTTFTSDGSANARVTLTIVGQPTYEENHYRVASHH